MADESSQFFTKIGRTVYVSGDASKWSHRLLNSFPGVRSEAGLKAYAEDSAKQIDLVVFVNTTSQRPERQGLAYGLIEKFKVFNVSTAVVGRCDVFCSGVFMGGKTRTFGQDLPSQLTFLDIQPPIDPLTGKLELRFWEQQFSLFINQEPRLSAFSTIWEKAFNQVVDDSGGLSIFPDQKAKYCASRKSENTCEVTGANALEMGIVTDGRRGSFVLPREFIIN
ncbi:MAG: hypothetical protein Q7K57_44175 [Burkholderiaceae bacterium]|nr:hypothetical protein [Burkholderiaceae bacterium]